MIFIRICHLGTLLFFQQWIEPRLWIQHKCPQFKQINHLVHQMSNLLHQTIYLLHHRIICCIRRIICCIRMFICFTRLIICCIRMFICCTRLIICCNEWLICLKQHKSTPATNPTDKSCYCYWILNYSFLRRIIKMFVEKIIDRIKIKYGLKRQRSNIIYLLNK